MFDDSQSSDYEEQKNQINKPESNTYNLNIRLSTRMQSIPKCCEDYNMSYMNEK